MDDNLELPTASVPHQTEDDAEDDAQSSDEDDGGLDWTKLPCGISWMVDSIRSNILRFQLGLIQPSIHPKTRRERI